MIQSRPLCLGLDSHKDTIAVALVSTHFFMARQFSKACNEKQSSPA